MSAPIPPSSGLSHAASLVSRFDRDRFATALFAPLEQREALMLLYAFNVEIALVLESVREPMAGMIRLQWWQDTLIAGLDGGTCDNHPVARPLCALIRDRNLPLEAFDDLISARRDDLEGMAPADLAAAERQAERSSAALTALALAVLGDKTEDSRRLGRHVGIAWGLVGNLRALGHHLSIGKLTLPEDLLCAAGTSGEAVREGAASTDSLTQVARILGGQARHHLSEARRLRATRSGLPAVLPAILADGYLQVIEKAGWNPFDSRVSQSRPRPIRLMLAHLTGRI
ncbi:putative Phytoene/squalene synthetase [Magnetospirillum sp. XM-1]|uniref:phytoene/squalene synthase family protein n=1 Tax=Magnetospirillum sp. XM-1 TaxID=1663591 RepID=UPI00073DEAB2|nr:squalene/phytoene synthase family protein [Magnetospirillum sp. XM-1]CUW40329.1 putative Phytoene/squalene synthetase [Magnetospirillum sp. XM-1]